MIENGSLTLSFDDHSKLEKVTNVAKAVSVSTGIKPALVIPPDFLPEAMGLKSIAGYDVVRGHQFAVVIPVEVQ